MRRFTPDFAKTIPPEATKVFAGKIFDVFQWPQQLFDGSTTTFEMLRRPDTVKVIAVKDDNIVLIKERQPRLNWCYDFPSGRHDHPEEDELIAAKRELLEETGMSFKNWKLIAVRQPFVKIDWLVYTFLATDFDNKIPQKLDSGEQIEVLKMNFNEAKKLLDEEAKKPLGHNSELNRYRSLSDLLNAPTLYNY